MWLPEGHKVSGLWANFADFEWQISIELFVDLREKVSRFHMLSLSSLKILELITTYIVHISAT